MNVMGEYSMESRQRFLKQQLSALGYDPKFSADALPLLENIVSDLLQTTDTLKHYKSLSNNCLQACYDLEQFLDAYKKDNAWLVQELNTLHLNTLSEKVSFEKRIAELEARRKNLNEPTESVSVSKNDTKSCTRNKDRRTYIDGRANTAKTDYRSSKDPIRDKDIEIKLLRSEILRLNNLLSGGRPLETILKEGPCTCDRFLEPRPVTASHQNVQCSNPESHNKSGIYSEKLKFIEEELVSLKNKYQQLGTEAGRAEKCSPEKLSKLQKEGADLRDKCNKLTLEKKKLLEELEETKKAYESTKTAFSKMDKEVLQLRRSQQELLAEKSCRDKDLKKHEEERTYLSNRIQELSIIERDLSAEVTRLCNVNAIHKRHILELENKLLDSLQSKGKALLSTLKPDIIKKPLEKRATRINRNKENVSANSNTADAGENAVLTTIREKYSRQIESLKMDYVLKPSQIEEQQSTVSVKDRHDCEHCKMVEKLICEYKEKMITLEAEKRDLIFRFNESQKIVECDKQHIMQLRSELHAVQMELQHCKTESSRYSRLEEHTNFTVESTKAVQKQLEIQLESMQKHIHLVEQENESVKSEVLSLRETNLKLQKNMMDSESEMDRISASLEEKTKKINAMEKSMKSKEQKILNLEQLVDDQQKQLNASTSRTESKKLTSSLEYLRSKVRSLEKSKDQVLADYRRLQREHSELQDDYNACKSDLKKSKKEAADLKAQIHDYIAKVRSAEETLQEKTKERSEMLDHFHTLTIEANQLESSNQTLESEARSTRNALRSAEAKIVDLEHIVQNKDALIAGYEEQLNELTKSVASLEMKVSSLTDQRDRLQAELDSSELLCSRSQRDNSSVLQSSYSKISEELTRLKMENELLQNYLSKEKKRVSELENVLSKARSEQSSQNTSVLEFQEVTRGLKATIKCLQESLEVANNQLRKAQNEADEYQREIIQLKRELRNLQFECGRNAGDRSNA